MDSNTIQKYKKYSVAQLKSKAQSIFNKWIRERDKELPCISCGTGKPEQAGHFYSAGHYNHMRFLENNTHGQCIRCNHFLSGNLIGYRKGLEKRIGKERVLELDELAIYRGVRKIDRFALVEIIEKYKQK